MIDTMFVSVKKKTVHEKIYITYLRVIALKLTRDIFVANFNT